MSLDTASLPDDVSLLKAMLVVADAELEQLRMQVAKLRRMQFGTSSERLTREADQLELGLLLSPELAERLIDAQVDAHVRGWEKTSDHAPVWIELADAAKPRSRSGRKARKL